MHTRLFLGAILGIGILSGSAAQGTVAHFTTAVTSEGNTFSAGTLRVTDFPTSSFLTKANLLPGASFSAELTINNPGTLDFNYAMTTTPSDYIQLANDLLLTIRAGTCAAGDGAVLYGDPSGAPLAVAAFGNRHLSPGSETLCFTVLFPYSAPASDQNQTLTSTFDFLAQQS